MIFLLAVDLNGGFSNEGKIAWNNPGDMKHFKEMTIGKTVLMGMNTYQSIGKALPNRKNLVFTRKDIKLPDAEVWPDVEYYRQHYPDTHDHIVIGGLKLFKSFTPSVIYLTIIEDKYTCDRYIKEDPTLYSIYKNIISIFYSESKEDDYKSNYTIRVYLKSDNYTVYECREEENPDEENFVALINTITSDGVREYNARTQIYTLRTFGSHLSFNLRDNTFPLTTLRKSYLKPIFTELMWFLNGRTSSDELEQKNLDIWKGNSRREFLDKMGLNHLREGDCGPIYGFQWRRWGAKYRGCDFDYSTLPKEEQGHDQITTLLETIKRDPSSRRMIISGWNVSDLKEMCLPPCHTMYQFAVMNGELNCHLYQRSSDILLAGMWNVASASLLVYLIAHITGLKPGTLTVSYGDVHIYENHLNAVKQHLIRTPFPYPKLFINTENKDLFSFKYEDLRLEGYRSYPGIKMVMNP